MTRRLAIAVLSVALGVVGVASATQVTPVGPATSVQPPATASPASPPKVAPPASDAPAVPEEKTPGEEVPGKDVEAPSLVSPVPPAPTTLPRVVGATTVPSIESLPEIPKPPIFPKTPIGGEPALPYGSVSTIDELRSLERQVEETSKRVIPATVGLQIGASSGSGVIISPEGWILTAGHVIDQPGRPVTVIFSDGRRARGITMGGNRSVDSGLVRLLGPGPWPYAEMGTSEDLVRGQWLIAIGHPGGYRVGRSPVVRLGRLTAADVQTLTTDNTLVGGDSGGPLYDLNGRVVGIHSRISQLVTVNMHVPVDQFVKDWDRISKGEAWGFLGPRMPEIRLPYMGVQWENSEGGLKLRSVVEGSPAEKAGLRAGDTIVKIDGREMKTQADVIMVLQRRAAGQVVSVEVVREGAENQTLKVRLARPPNARTPQPGPNPTPPRP